MAINNCITQNICEQAIQMNLVDGDCDHQMFSGIEQTALIINKADIKSVTTDTSNPRIVNEINFAAGKKGFGIINARNNPYQGTNTTVEVGDYKNTFTRTVSLFVPMDGAEASQKVLDPLANGKFVVIMENQYHNANEDNVYQIYGIDKGLVVSSMTQTKYENNDYWLVELQESGVPNSGRFLIHEETTNIPNAMGNLTFNDGYYTGTVSDGGTFSVEASIKDMEWETGDDGQGNPYWYFEQTIDGTVYVFYDYSNEPSEGNGFQVDSVDMKSTTDDYICTLFTQQVNP